MLDIVRLFLSLLSLQEAARRKSYGKVRNSHQAMKKEKKIKVLNYSDKQKLVCSPRSWQR